MNRIPKLIAEKNQPRLQAQAFSSWFTGFMAEPSSWYTPGVFLREPVAIGFLFCFSAAMVIAVVYILTKSHSAKLRDRCQGQFHPAIENGGFL